MISVLVIHAGRFRDLAVNGQRIARYPDDERAREAARLTRSSLTENWDHPLTPGGSSHRDCSVVTRHGEARSPRRRTQAPRAAQEGAPHRLRDGRADTRRRRQSPAPLGGAFATGSRLATRLGARSPDTGQASRSSSPHPPKTAPT